MKKKIKQSHTNIYWTQYVVGPTHPDLLVLGPCQSQLVLWLIQDPLGSGVRKVVGRVRCGVRLTGALMTCQPQSSRPLRTQNLPSGVGHICYQPLQ